MKKITLLLLLLTTTLSFSQVSIGGGDDGDGFNSPPISPYYGYSYSQSIYLASEIGTSGDITSIEYALNAGSNFTSADDNVDVWIGHTAKTAFDSTSDWVDVSTLSHVLIDGTVTVNNNVLTITFNSSFTYNGTDNIVIAVDANEPGYGSSSAFVLSTNGPTVGLTLDQRSDSTNSDPTSPATGTLRQNRGNVTFNGITQSCPTPNNLVATANSLTEVEISWTAGGTETEWTYEFGPTGFTQGSGTLTVTGPNNPITLGGLTPGATYDIYVQANCGGSSGNSSWLTTSWTMPIAGDTLATATDLPFTISPEGTGCTTSNLSIDFPNSGFTASGLVSQGTAPTGVDAFFNWTATTDALRYWGTGSGFPYIGIHDASGTEIAYSTYNQADVVLSGWAIGDELVIRIYDYGTSMVNVEFCLEYYTLPSAPNCAENVSPTGSDVSFNNGAATITWDAPSSGIAPTGYEVFWGTTSGDLTSIGVIDAPTTTANILGLSYGATYYYSVVPQNGASLAVGCTEYSLTIENAPIPFSTDFTNYPAGFTESEGPFGAPDATDNDSAWDTSDFLNDATLGKGAKVNIYGTSRDEYLISPTFDLSAGTHYLNIDAGITDWNGTGADAGGMDVDEDYVSLVFSEDDGVTWSELYRWDSTSGLTNASQAMPEVSISSTSSTAKFALYAYSGVSGADYDFHVTNFQVTTTTLGTANNILEGFTLYPTIVKEELNFRSQNNVETITVFNLLGQKVFSGAPNTNNSSINLSTLRPGVYVVKVSAEGKIGSYKIIKE
jgi:hypothetical protein